MRVLIFGHKIFADDMAWGFSKIGCDASVLPSADIGYASAVIRYGRADLIVTMGEPLELNRALLTLLSFRDRDRTRLVHWDTDGISSLGYTSMSGIGIEMDVILLSKPDFVFTICPEMQALLGAKGYRCALLPFGFCPLTHRPNPHIDSASRYINLVGNSYVEFYRENKQHPRYQSLKLLLEPLLTAGYTVDIYGDYGHFELYKELFGIDFPKEHFHGRLPYERTSAVYNDSFVNIVTQNHPQTLTKRTFEVLGSGGFALTVDTPAVRQFFRPGENLAASNSEAETLRIVSHYESHRDEWMAVRKNAAASVREEHNYQRRAERILQSVFHKRTRIENTE